MTPPRSRTGVSALGASYEVSDSGGQGLFRFYEESERGRDGYPPEWHETIKGAVREQAGHRCVRCGHPYLVGGYGGEWSLCDSECTHAGEASLAGGASWEFTVEQWAIVRELIQLDVPVYARWRILTVHHLDGDKGNCRWWNLASLCQRCHLTVQGRVVMARVWPWEHSDWFKPYVAGFYAWAYLGEELSREQVDVRLDELLDLERVVK